jgi:hypothetical protein
LINSGRLYSTAAAGWQQHCSLVGPELATAVDGPVREQQPSEEVVVQMLRVVTAARGF